MTEAETLYSDDWWHSRSNSELQELTQRGLFQGGLCEGAAREIERRAREADRIAKQVIEYASKQKQQRTGRVALAISVLYVVVAALAILANVVMHAR